MSGAARCIKKDVPGDFTRDIRHVYRCLNLSLNKILLAVDYVDTLLQN